MLLLRHAVMIMSSRLLRLKISIIESFSPLI